MFEIALPDHAGLPAVGLGTWQLSGAACVRAVTEALAIGYRHIDTAQMYGNEREVGSAVLASGVPREEVFITTKVWPSNFRRRDLRSSVEKSLRDLKTPYIDLLLLHWPNASVELKETMGALDAAKAEGLARHIGVSNFGSQLLSQAASLTTQTIANNQIEYHVGASLPDVVTTARGVGCSITAYSPLAKGAVNNQSAVKRIAAKHGVSAAQIALHYLVVCQGVAVVPKASSPDRLLANFSIYDIHLDDEDRLALSRLKLRQ
ncbi:MULTISPECIES: aldo/keto reductase [Rhodanobacteraceae]|uniref:aldo/keto reductase n=1 Tax=Rhodanobacteraceae TaxID=1775411 RepID=UPI0008849FC8|nr:MULTISPECIES: aldo/keto reductase [Rhodanobacteraceae]SDG02441.1 2,5-diketo-D-gluconate reductase B [Dyella sp. 333MFSha]SKB30647.1 2,5-diketo-D-gluconate reductase B [Luteibacter sp. 22Crub2.1]